MEQTFSLKQKLQVTPPNPEGASLFYFKCFENFKVLLLGVSRTTAIQESPVPVSNLSLIKIQKFSFLCLKSHKPSSPVQYVYSTNNNIDRITIKPLTFPGTTTNCLLNIASGITCFCVTDWWLTFRDWAACAPRGEALPAAPGPHLTNSSRARCLPFCKAGLLPRSTKDPK